MSTRIVSDFRMINYCASWKEADEVDARSRMSQKSKAFLGASLGQVNHRPADFICRQKGGAALQHYEYPLHVAAESQRNPEKFGLPSRCLRRRFHFDSRLEYLS